MSPAFSGFSGFSGFPWALSGGADKLLRVGAATRHVQTKLPTVEDVLAEVCKFPISH